MRKTLLLILTALALAAACAACAETCGDFEYAVLPDGTAELIRYTGSAEHVVIPYALDGHDITAVRGNPFRMLYDADPYTAAASDLYTGAIDSVHPCTVAVAADHPYLATIDGVLFGQSDRKLIYCPPALAARDYEIPQGIRVIGDYAFCECRGLRAVTIPDSVTAIGTGAFRDCARLSGVDLPDSLTAIPGEMFRGCGRLRGIAIPPTVTAVGDMAFFGCGLKEITLSDGLRSVGREAFRECAFASLVIPPSLTEIGINAFACSGNLSSAVLPDTMEEIPDGMFFRCTALAEIAIPASVRVIGGSAFEACTALTSAVIPDGVVRIGDFAFTGCTGLRSVTVPDSVTEIGLHAFDLGEYGAWTVNPDLVITVSRGSAAEAFCIANGIRYLIPGVVYGDNDSWLR